MTMHMPNEWEKLHEKLIFRSGLETYPHNPKIRYNWGNFLQKQNRYEDALAEYQKTVELQPDYFSALNNMGSMYEVLKYPKVRSYCIK